MDISLLKGKWIGEYTYRKAIGPDRGRAVSFLIDIRETGRKFKGYGVDYDTVDLFDQPALIEGTFKDDKISFTKKYPSLFGLNESNSPVAYPDYPPQLIQFNGYISKIVDGDRIFFMGDWWMTHFNFNRLGQMKQVRTEGFWSMKRTLPVPSIL